MIKSIRKLTRFKYAVTLVGALAVVALAPATAHALPVSRLICRRRSISATCRARRQHAERQMERLATVV
jgi:hypothetical protein